MQFVILGLLLDGPLSLYDVHKRFRAGISLFYRASFGSIQRALQGLVDSGAVTVADEPGHARRRKLHTVTTEGRARWRAWMLEPIAAGADAETLVLAKVYLLGRLDDAADRRAVLDLVRERAAASAAELEDLSALIDASASGIPDDLRLVAGYQRATLDYGVRSHGLALRWIDELRAEERAISTEAGR